MAFDPFTEGFNLVRTALDKIFPDATEEMKQKFTLANQEVASEIGARLAQLEINKEEAKHPSIFVAGGRPAAIWVSVASLLYSGIGVSFLSWVAVSLGLPPVPAIDTTTQSNLLYALLGIGTMRTIDKFNGTDTKKVGAK